MEDQIIKSIMVLSIAFMCITVSVSILILVYKEYKN